MKLFLSMALLAFSISAFSASVKVTSFNYIRQSQDMLNPVAELCGLVEGASTSPSFVHVLVDSKGNNSASYNTYAANDGRFCLVVITYRGTAEVSLVGTKSSVTANIK